ncbi:hypothetical protein [Biostraticola tofi]|uniref:Binding-protein-dependent transport system inner membrane component n=1 Tax=Biostraticola tofi TaxID=466109 RepID=A0A4R3YV89_9GAMM|nr:hypothetical protein [Biostraticola tofi]TCV95123.1 hypothetical protein EDC52_10654 [Biostraticola tofi]
MTISLVVTVFTEMIAGNSGMGYFILNSQQNMAVDDMYTGVCSLAIIGYMLNLLFLWLERRLIFWHASMHRRPV